MELLEKISAYDVVWHSPSKSDRGYMPIGNGNLSMSLWVEEDGDLQFYFSVMDALTETDRNVKLGKVRLRLTPNPFPRGGAFCQALRLADGCIEIRALDASLRVFVAENDVICIEYRGETARSACAELINWRTREPKERESADVVSACDGGVQFYHQNKEPFIDWCLGAVDLPGNRDKVNDLLTDRIFGGFLTLGGGTADGNAVTMPAGTSFVLKISAGSEQTKDREGFLRELRERCARTSPEAAFEESRRVWHAYWEKSWVFVEGDERAFARYTPEFDALELDGYDDGYNPPSRVTAAYLLTKYMFRTNSRGRLPMRYNGLEFNAAPGGGKPFDFFHFAKSLCEKTVPDPTPSCNPDERPWGDGTLWQNIRHPYFSMLARGEYEELRTLFDLYLSFGPINRAAAQAYYGAQGQYNTEITTTLGTIFPGVYGFEREGLPKGYSQNRWGGAVDISPGLELSCLMLDYCAHSGDEGFLREKVVPYVKELFLYIATRFSGRKDGKIDLYPLHAVETYWDTRNPVTVVSGMRAVLERCRAAALSPEDRAWFAEMEELTPDLPMNEWNGRRVLDNADEYDPERHNVEPVELYALFPFGCFGIGKPELAMMADTYEHTKEYGNFRPYVLGEQPGAPSYSGWQYVGQAAAMLQKREDVREILQENAALTNKAFRFPAAWGPIYDSVPDVDHGGSFLATLQLAVLQWNGDAVYVLPALPAGWDVSFRLCAPRDTWVTCEYRAGKLSSLSVEPPERAKDVVVLTEDGEEKE